MRQRRGTFQAAPHAPMLTYLRARYASVFELYPELYSRTSLKGNGKLITRTF